MELNYKTFGQGSPVLILHGLFGTLDNWQTIGKQIAEHHMVYLIDQRNHGKSPHTDDFNYPLLAEDLHHFMESQWIHEAHIIGHSMGGKTAMQFALDYPDMVDRLAVIDIGPKAYVGGHQDIFAAMLDLPIGQINTRQEAADFLAQRIPDEGVRLFLLKNLSRQKEGGYRWKHNLQALHTHYAEILEPVIGPPVDQETLFVRGGNSNYIENEDWPQIQAMFPAARLETVAGAGHWVHAEQPQKLLEILLPFLNESS
ncbi:MAG: alpha/beta fold hydrolase [Bacteroidota bacterium]